MKNPLWKQPTPLMQYNAILMGLDGWTGSIEIAIKGCGLKMETIIPKIRDHVEQLRELIPFLEGKENW